MGVSIGDSLAATYGCMGALAALRHRDKTGEGQVVDSALYEAVLQVMESLVPEYVASGYVRERSGSVLPGIAPSNVYPCSDGEYLIGANQDTVFGRLCAAMGRPELATDERYATHVARGRNQVELDDLIAAWTRTLTIDELEALMIEHGVPAGKLFRPQDMLEDPHFAAREAIIDVPHPRWGTLKMQNVFPKLSKTPGSVRRAAPATVGQDNAAVYASVLGLTETELADLESRGII
jgi:formyl-CoA transferase